METLTVSASHTVCTSLLPKDFAPQTDTRANWFICEELNLYDAESHTCHMGKEGSAVRTTGRCNLLHKNSAYVTDNDVNNRTVTRNNSPKCTVLGQLSTYPNTKYVLNVQPWWKWHQGTNSANLFCFHKIEINIKIGLLSCVHYGPLGQLEASWTKT